MYGCIKLSSSADAKTFSNPDLLQITLSISSSVFSSLLPVISSMEIKH
jgi:hypothetical protein